MIIHFYGIVGAHYSMLFVNVHKNPLFASFVLFFTAALIGGLWFIAFPYTTKGETSHPVTVQETTSTEITGKHVIIYLKDMKLELKDGNTVLETLPLLSKGKPGSYYETIGGLYYNDYKTPLHFSSIGHVYMPHSVHVFGNYFIHGVPYYEDGTPVSSTYSGGCIRLEDANASKVYDFIKRGTPILITQDDEEVFTSTDKDSETLLKKDMTALMVATISLETLTQDNEITSLDGEGTTTRKTLLPLLINEHNDDVAHRYAQALGTAGYIEMMNKKARALGLTNTTFDSVTFPATTTYQDYVQFMHYIRSHKSYLLKL